MVDIIPCMRKDSKVIRFLVGQTDEHVFILDNYVWAVATKAVPIEEWRRDWKRVVVPEEKLRRILEGLMKYAVFAGMTPEAGQHLTKMIPFPKNQERIALDKGYATLDRFKTQAAAEEATDKMKIKRLTGAPLDTLYKKTLEEMTPSASKPEPEQIAEPGTSNNATESGKRAGEVGSDEPALARRRTGSGKAAKIRSLARQVTSDLEEVEAEGGNPAELTKGQQPIEVNKAVKRVKIQKAKEAKAAKGNGAFDPAKLKGPDGKYKSASAMFKGLILEGKLNDDKIFAAVQKQFGLDDDKRSYVNWNRNWLKKEGVIS